MSYQKQIHLYLSGELKAEEEKALFDGLAAHPEWREELALQLQMQNVIQKDISLVSIPPATTKAIFSSLGFAVPVATMPSAPQSPFSRLFGGWLTRYPMLSMWSSAAIVTLLLSMQFSGSSSEDTQTHAAAIRSVVPSRNTSGNTAVRVSSSSKATQSSSSMQNVVQEKQSITTPVEEHQGGQFMKAPTMEQEGAKHPSVKNVPMKEIVDIGKLPSVDYITQNKIVGVAEQGKIFASEDGGKNWTRQQSNTANDLNGVNFTDRLNGIAVGNRGTILRTVDGGATWTPISAGITSTLNGVGFVSKNTAYICGSQGTILKSTTGGATWEKLSSGVNASLFSLQVHDDTVTVRGERGTTLRSTDAGRSWARQP